MASQLPPEGEASEEAQPFDQSMIVGGYEGAGGNITVSGGTVTATGNNSAGIGGSYSGAGGNITISGGTVTATGGSNGGKGIGGGSIGADGTLALSYMSESVNYMSVYATSYGCDVTIGSGCSFKTVDGSTVIMSGNDIGNAAGKVIVPADSTEEKVSVAYVNAAGRDMGQRACVKVTDQTDNWGESGKTTWYAVTENATIGSGITVTGNVNLILCDDKTLKAEQGITVTEGNRLTVWAQRTADGETADTKMGVLTWGNGGGVYINGGSFMLQGGTITGGNQNFGGGVNVGGGTFTMTGGTITGGNQNFGGGVYVNFSGTFNMTGGTITKNTAKNGGGYGGVYVYGGSFTMTGGTISGNTATNDGGGVYLTNGSTFTMNGGTISGNTATNGGGVYVVAGGMLNMTGGSITVNTATNNGGVYVDSGTFNVNGAPSISGNTKDDVDYNNVYLESGRTITVTGKLTTDAKIGVRMETPGVFTSGYSRGGTGDSAYTNPASPELYFTSDDTKDPRYVVHPVNGEAALGVLHDVTVDPGIQNGDITPDKLSAIEGETVTLTPVPSRDYVTSIVTYSAGGTTTVVKPVNDAYSFAMPADNVVVSATFETIAPAVSITWVKSDTPKGGYKACDTMSYTVTATNTGNVKVPGFTVSTAPAANGEAAFTYGEPGQSVFPKA